MTPRAPDLLAGAVLLSGIGAAAVALAWPPQLDASLAQGGVRLSGEARAAVEAAVAPLIPEELEGGYRVAGITFPPNGPEVLLNHPAGISALAAFRPAPGAGSYRFESKVNRADGSPPRPEDPSPDAALRRLREAVLSNAPAAPFVPLSQTPR